MIKLLVYTDGKPASTRALRYAAVLQKRLGAELAVITVRSGTHSAEDPPTVGRPVSLEDKALLPRGLQILAESLDTLAAEGILDRPRTITIRDVSQGYLFVCKSPSGERIPFYECFGDFIGALNKEVDSHCYDLLIIAPPRRKGLKRLVAGDTTRKLSLDLHTSILVVRAGGPDSRHLICADGSPSSKRQFPLINHLLPAIGQPPDLFYAKRPDADSGECAAARDCLQQAVRWLETCGKKGRVIEKETPEPAAAILDEAGSGGVIVMGASLRHDVYRRMRGSLPIEILARTESTVLLVKLPAEADTDFLKAPFTCE